MHLNMVCPSCGLPLVVVLPKGNIHKLPDGKIVGMTTAYTECSSCKAKSAPYVYEAIITIAMGIYEVKN